MVVPTSIDYDTDYNSDVFDPRETFRDDVHTGSTLGWRAQFATNAVAALCNPHSFVRGTTPRHLYPSADFCDPYRDVQAPHTLDRCDRLRHFPFLSANYICDEQRMLAQNTQQHLLLQCNADRHQSNPDAT